MDKDLSRFKKIIIPNVELKYEYLISDNGEVYSVISKKFLKGDFSSPYHRVRLQTKEGGKVFSIHRLVLIVFNPILGMEELEVNHLDGDKRNNVLENLEWCTRKQNAFHAKENGRYDFTQEYEHKKKIRSLTEEEVKHIISLLIENKMSHQEIAELYKVHKETIARIRRKEIWSEFTSEINLPVSKNIRKNRQTKLTESQVLEIIELLLEKIPQRTIALKYGVAQFTIGRIYRKQTWKDLTQDIQF